MCLRKRFSTKPKKQESLYITIIFKISVKKMVLLRMKGKKAQAAMEFLMTYGWAILIILVVLGVLFYLGVFSPKTPNTCELKAPIQCNDVKVEATKTTFALGASGVDSASI